MGNSGNSMVGAGRGWPAGSRQPFHIKPRAPCPAFPSALELRSETTAIAMRCPLLALGVALVCGIQARPGRTWTPKSRRVGGAARRGAGELGSPRPQKSEGGR